MRLSIIFVAIVAAAGCSGGGSTPVKPSSVPNGAGGGDDGGMPMPGGSDGGGGGGGGSSDGGVTGGTDAGSGNDGGAMAGPCSTTPKLIARQQYYTQGLAVDDTTVYFAAHDSMRTQNLGAPVRVWSVPIAGGTPTALSLPENDGGSVLMTMNATAIFFAQTGEIVRLAKDGSSRQVLTQDDPFCLADARGYVYYCAGGGIYRVPEDGGAAPATVVAMQYITSSIAFDATQIWFPYSQTIRRAPADGGAAVDVTSVHDGWAINDVAVDDRAVYFDTGNSGNLYVADKIDGTTARLLIHRDGFVSKLTVDGGNVYWVGPGWYIARVARDGSGATTLVSPAGYVSSLVIRGDSIFYTQWDDGSIYRVCK